MATKTLAKLQPDLARTHNARRTLTECLDHQRALESMLLENKERLQLLLKHRRELRTRLQRRQAEEAQLREQLAIASQQDRAGVQAELARLQAELESEGL